MLSSGWEGALAIAHHCTYPQRVGAISTENKKLIVNIITSAIATFVTNKAATYC